MRTIAHVISPVLVGPSSDLYVAQPVTFETMKIAREFARGKVDVTLCSAQYSEDRSIVPQDFHLTPDLDRSVLDLGTFRKKRKLPLVVDILDRCGEASNAEFLIYSNVDIALLPNFYVTVNRMIEAGYDAFVINRRTVSSRYQSIKDIPLMYADAGRKHPGHDCFVFRRDVYEKYKLGTVCIGTSWVGRVLIWNLACHARRFKEFKRLHLTFHLGNDKIWQESEYSDYLNHNRCEALQILGQLETAYGPFNGSHPFSRYKPQVTAEVQVTS